MGANQIVGEHGSFIRLKPLLDIYLTPHPFWSRIIISLSGRRLLSSTYNVASILLANHGYEYKKPNKTPLISISIRYVGF